MVNCFVMERNASEFRPFNGLAHSARRARAGVCFGAVQPSTFWLMQDVNVSFMAELGKRHRELGISETLAWGRCASLADKSCFCCSVRIDSCRKVAFTIAYLHVRHADKCTHRCSL